MRVQLLRVLYLDNPSVLMFSKVLILLVYHVFHHFVIKVSDRDELKAFLLSNGVETGIHYPGNINSYKAYPNYPYGGHDFGANIISLPVAEHLNKLDIERVCNLVNKFCN